MNKTVKSLMRFFGASSELDEAIREEAVEETYRTVSDNESKKLIAAAYTPSNRTTVDVSELPSIINPIHEELVGKKIDSERLFQLAPEVEHAASILIPSILSPQDLRPNPFTLSFKENDESPDVTEKLLGYFNEHFGDELGMTDKLPQWIQEALFKSGAKAVAVLPASVITNLRNSSVSLETLETERNNTRIPKVASVELLNDVSTNEIMIDEFVAIEGIESAISHHGKKVGDSVDVNATVDGILSKDNLKPLIDAFSESSNICFSHDVRLLATPDVITHASNESINSKFLDILKKNEDSKATYKVDEFVDLTEYTDEKEGSNLLPTLLDLPMESVIPIVVEGSPENHIAYIVVLNENGIPLSAEYYGSESQGSSRFSNKSDPAIQKMFDTFYNSGGNFGSISRNLSSQTKTNVVEVIYKSYLNRLLSQQAKGDNTMAKYDIKMNNEVSRIMFSRLMKNKQTTMVMIPKNLMMYMAFWYNNNGTGRSKLDNIKFPLSLKLTLVISRLIALMESATNRRRLNIELNDSVPNPLEVLKTMKKQITDSKLHGLSYDPTSIIKTIMDKQITIVPQNLPGVENFSITDEENSVTYPRPDPDLMDEVQNMYMLSLDVPPSALNRLSEDEFSSSVVTNNIFLSNKIKGYQVIVCRNVSFLVRTYVSYSSKMHEGIKTILKESTSEETSDTENTDEALTKRVKRIIRNLELTLPPPSMSNNKAQDEEVNNFIGIIDKVLEGLYPEEMLLDQELADTMKAMKAHMKSVMLSDYISTSAAFPDINFPDMGEIKIENLLNLQQKITNLKKGSADLAAGLSGGEEEEGGGDSYS